jgi:dipeptidyl aminopeptidase/acylaminoacyl peptidase
VLRDLASQTLAVVSLLSLAFVGLAGEPTPIRIEDAVTMTRIKYPIALDQTTANFSPDGSRFAAVVWRGDPARNVNVFTLLLFETNGGEGASRPIEILSRDFEGDPLDQSVSPIADVTLLGDNRTIAFLGREGSGGAQVFSVDTKTRRVRRLTNHPTAVRSYAMGPDGSLLGFSAVADDPDEAKRAKRLAEDGVFAADAEIFSDRRRFLTGTLGISGVRPWQVRQYFLTSGAAPKLIFDSRRSRPRTPPDQSDPKVAAAPLGALDREDYLRGMASWTVDPHGRQALLFPYALTEHEMGPERYSYYETMNAYARRVAAPYGVVDLRTGRIERLIDAPHPQFARPGTGSPFWSPDGRSVVIHSLLPLDASDAAENAERAKAPPQWIEVDLATRRVTPIGVPGDWRVVRWDPRQGLVLSRGSRFARVARKADGAWGALEDLGAVDGFSSEWHPVATNGRVVVGVREASLTPPEVAAYDLVSKRVEVLTDLNPRLRGRKYGAVESLRWAHKYEHNAFAFLIKPVDYEPGRRYPLVVLLDDGVLRQEGEPFLLDGTAQLSGHAIQPLAAAGFVVLYPRQPASLRSVISTPKEATYMREHIESAIAELDRSGLIDASRVGISGWSRHAYITDSLLIHSRFRFAAASQIDGGALEYNEAFRPFTDEELRRIQTPLLIQAHGPSSLAYQAGMADRMDAMGKPIEVLYFATAPHATVRPQHRLRSLGTHVDWWRFWLQDYEDPDPTKQAQYRRWRELKTGPRG